MEQKCGCKIHYAEGEQPKYSLCEYHKKRMTEYDRGNFPIINGAGNGDGLGGGLGLIALLALLGRRGFGGDEGGGRNLEAVIAEQVGDLRHDLGESTVENLKETFQSEKDAIIAGFKSEIETLKSMNKIENKISECCEEEQKSITCLREDMDNKFCALEHMVEKGFDNAKTREILEENATLRRQVTGLETANQTATIISTILGAVGVVVPTAKKTV